MSFTISVLVGSTRPGRQGLRVAQYVAKKLKERGHTVNFIDPLEYKGIQTFVDRYKNLKEPNADLVAIHNLFEKSDGFVAITPEYNYSYSSQIKTFLDVYLNEYKFKPLGMVSYSMGAFGGVRAIENLRQVANALGLSPVPTYAALPTVHTQFEENGDLKNDFNKQAFEALFREFEWYLAALANQRKLDPSILPK